MKKIEALISCIIMWLLCFMWCCRQKNVLLLDIVRHRS